MPSEHKSSHRKDAYVNDSFRWNPDQEDGTGSTYSTDPEIEPKKKHRKTPAVSSQRRKVLICVIVLSILLILVGVVIAVAFAVSGRKNGDNATDMSPRRRKMEEFLYSNQITTLPQLRETDSPSNLAAAFIADEDELQIQLTEETAKLFVERYILAFLYYHFGGPEWKHNFNFLSSTSHCDWNQEMETSTGTKLRQGVVCNEQGYVTELNLGTCDIWGPDRIGSCHFALARNSCIAFCISSAWNNLHGTEIPEQIKFLKEMVELHLYYNEIGGYLPFGIREMTNLKSMGLIKMGLIGTIPFWIGEMTSLTSLGLGQNFLQGPLPSGLGALTGLKLLGLDSNDGLAGNIAVLKQLTNLEALYLEDNYLSGDLSDINWPNLKELDISGNYITGTIPAYLLGHPTLTVLDVNNNQFVGEFPSIQAFNEKLEYLAIHNNLVTGSLTDQLEFLNRLKHLDVSFNSLSGAMPDSLGQLTSLQYLATSGNVFAPQGILDIRRLTNLVDFSMKDNNLNGTIPTWFSELTNLKLLDLDANALTGSIPAEIGEMTGLEYLLLNRNRLTGTLPDFSALAQLDLLLLDGNSLTGTASSICNSNTMQLTNFIADCYPGRAGEPIEFECPCCTQCCRAGDGVQFCNDQAWTANVDLFWEVGNQRQEYDFNLETAPAEYAKASNP
jgi:Leucine-rich repeat (LRR) protein